MVKNTFKIKYNSKVISLFDYYLFNCPIKYNNGAKVCPKALSFDEMNISGHKLIALYKEISECKIILVYIDRKDLAKMAKKYANKKNYIIYCNLSNLGKTKSLFYCIRNAFAHGAFTINRDMVLGENYNKGYLKGRFCISIDSLTKIIDIVKRFGDKNVQ